MEKKTTRTSPHKIIHILSDSTGELAIHQVYTMLSQFPPHTFRVKLFNFLDQVEAWEGKVKSCLPESGVILHSTSDPEKKQTLSRLCRSAKYPQFDLTGPLMNFLESEAHHPSARSTIKLHDMDDYYYNRVEAIEFAFEHDDSLNSDHLRAADIILVGLSRTSKTPVALYLANKGLKVANVSLTLESGLPRQLEKHTGNNIVGLKINLPRLLKKRLRRAERMGIQGAEYADKNYVSREIRLANQIFKSYNWPTMDISFSSIEETSWKIISLLDLTSRLKYIAK